MLARVVNTALRRNTPKFVRFMGGGGDHHGPLMPPFARRRPPTGSVRFSLFFTKNELYIFLTRIYVVTYRG
jgi:hypothetical protein